MSRRNVKKFLYNAKSSIKKNFVDKSESLYIVCNYEIKSKKNRG